MNYETWKSLQKQKNAFYNKCKDIIFNTRSELEDLTQDLSGEEDADRSIFQAVRNLRKTYTEKGLPEIEAMLKTHENYQPTKGEIASIRKSANRLDEELVTVIMMEHLVPDEDGHMNQSYALGVTMVTDEKEDPFAEKVKAFKESIFRLGNATTNYATGGAYPERTYYGDEYVLRKLDDLERQIYCAYEEMVDAQRYSGEADEVFAKWEPMLTQFVLNVQVLELAFGEHRHIILKPTPNLTPVKGDPNHVKI